MPLRIRVHEKFNEESIKQTKEWKLLSKFVTKMVSQAEIDSRRCYEAFKYDHPNDGACWIIFGNPPIMVMPVWTVRGIGSITWHTVPFNYKGDYGSTTDTDRKTAIDAITSKLYFGTSAMGRTLLEAHPNPTEEDMKSWVRLDPIHLKAFVGYDGTKNCYSANIADAQRVSEKKPKTLRKATPAEIADKDIAWAMEGDDKYNRRMVNYKLGIWRPLTEMEFYVSGTVD